MTRTEWRVLFHLGRYGAMTPRHLRPLAHAQGDGRPGGQVARGSPLPEPREKRQRPPVRDPLPCRAADKTLCARAGVYDLDLSARFAPEENEILRRRLRRLAGV